MTKLLAIDDDPGILDMLEMHFGMRGYEVLKAGSAQEGLRVAFKERPDVVVLDIGLEDHRGDVVLVRLKKYLQVKVLMLSGLMSASIQQEFLDLGADDFVPKGTPIGELQAHVDALVA